MSDDAALVPVPQYGNRMTVNLDAVRVQMGRPVRRLPTCRHTDLCYDLENRRVWCMGCKTTLDGFDAFMALAQSWGAVEEETRRRQQQADDAQLASLRGRATKALDVAWEGGLPAVACPHCRGGLLPEDFADGLGVRTTREHELARRQSRS